MKRSKNVFIGVEDAAGVCSRLKHGFDAIGVYSHFYSFQKHIFNYKTDKIIHYSDIKLIRVFQKIKLILILLIQYKYFIFVTPHTLFPNFKDIKILKFFGKKTMMIFTGCDVRIPEKVSVFKWNTCSDCTQEYKDFVGCEIERKIRRTKVVEDLFDIVSCPIEASGNLTRMFYPGFFPVDLSVFPSEKFKNYTFNKRLKIIHAPTNETYKGSKYIFETIERLRKKYDFEFKVIKNISIQEFYKEVAESDLVIDQMLLGGFGFVSIEAMAMYKPVISYLRDEVLEKVNYDCPIINANPDTLYEVIEKVIVNPKQLIQIGLKSREFVENYWDEKKVAEEYYNLFENIPY